jgi:hypothetical protein
VYQQQWTHSHYNKHNHCKEKGTQIQIQYNTKQRKPKWEKNMDHKETSIKIKIKSRLTEIAKTDR